MKAIQIAQPCHENWNEMKATDRGAFCQKCSVDVYDFSKMKLDDVKLVLLDNEGKHVCGRFDKRQMESINSEFIAWKKNQPAAFQSKFIFALLLVFGMSLFSCNEEDSEKIASLSTVELKSSLTKNENILADQLFFHQDAIIADEMVKYLETDDYIQKLEWLEMGSAEDHVTQTVTEGHYYALGGPMISAEYIEYLRETIPPVDTSQHSTLADPISSVYNPYQTKLFPNPTRDLSTFSIFINEPGQFTIDIYSLSGQLIKQLHNGELSEGQFNFDVDLSDQNPGMYLIKVWSDLQQETVKIIKAD